MNLQGTYISVWDHPLLPNYVEMQEAHHFLFWFLAWILALFHPNSFPSQCVLNRPTSFKICVGLPLASCSWLACHFWGYISFSILFFSPETSSGFLHVLLRILTFFLFLSSQYFLCTGYSISPSQLFWTYCGWRITFWLQSQTSCTPWCLVTLLVLVGLSETLSGLRVRFHVHLFSGDFIFIWICLLSCVMNTETFFF